MSKPKLTESDLCRAASRIGSSTAEIETFLEVETKGRGFDDQDRPLILFERHWFHKLTRGTYDATHPHISSAKPGGYGKSSEQYGRFSEAFALDPQAAMKSASWGLGQVMGFNHAIVGYLTVDAFVEAMKESEGKQLDAAIEFIIHNDLDDELRRHDWAGFARGYNGKNYKINQYDTKLANAYAKFETRKINCGSDSAAPSAPANSPTGQIPTEDAFSSITQPPAISPPTVTELKAEPIGDPVDAPATKVTQNGTLSQIIAAVGGLTTISSGVWAYIIGNPTFAVVATVCLTIIILALLDRWKKTDLARMEAASHPERFNVS